MTEEERIDRFFLGKMDDLERLDFDKEVMKNKKLADAVKEHKSLVNGLKTYGLKQKLNSIMAEGSHTKGESAEKKNASFFPWFYILLAMLVLGSLYFLLKPEAKIEGIMTAPALYAEHYYTDPGLPTKMGAQNDFEFDTGMVEFKQGNFKNSILQWEKGARIDAKTQYYLGAAYLADGNEAKAVKQFERLSPQDAFYDRAQWYLALIKLKNNKVDAAKGHLNSIIKLEQSNYMNRAEELLAKIPL